MIAAICNCCGEITSQELHDSVLGLVCYDCKTGGNMGVANLSKAGIGGVHKGQSGDSEKEVKP